MKTVTAILFLALSAPLSANCLTAKSAPQSCTVLQHAMVGAGVVTAFELAGGNRWDGVWIATIGGAIREVAQGDPNGLEDTAGFFLGAAATAAGLDHFAISKREQVLFRFAEPGSENPGWWIGFKVEWE